MTTTIEAAKQVRAFLRKTFPNTKISVTSHHDEVRVDWEDGPVKDDI
jgi:hypothetical protein